MSCAPVLVLVLALTVLAAVSVSAAPAAPAPYVGAVVEYCPVAVDANRTYTRAEALALIQQNVNALEGYVSEAKAQHSADILVFPEYGLIGWPGANAITAAGWTRDTIVPFTERIPDPRNHSAPINPCDTPDLFPGANVTIAVSCLAQRLGVHVVVDMADVVPCPDPWGLYPDSNCGARGDGRAQYNTAVAFDDTGVVLAKYHKHHLYGEDAFMDVDASPMPATFRTRFGRDFGLFICFDIVFQPFVENKALTDFAFPTYWDDTFLPSVFNATDAQADWSALHGVNLLAANIGFDWHSSGSGLWHSGIPLAEWNNRGTQPISKLLVAQMP